MEKCKTELDIKLNEHLINAAREIQLHCRGTMRCMDCIFGKTDETGYTCCRIGEDKLPDRWEVDNE